MRTTMTLEPDVAQQAKRAMAEKKLPFKRVINDALRAGFAALRKEKPVKFTVEPLHLGPCRPGIDPTKLGQFLDQLEVEEFLSKNPELRNKAPR